MSTVLEVPSCVRPSVRPRPSPGSTGVGTRRRRRRIITVAVIRRAVYLSLYAAVAYGFINSGVHPYVEAHRLSQEAAAVQQQIQVEEQKHETLARQVADLQTREGAQNAARTYGWVIKGEIPIACPHPDLTLSHDSDAAILALPAATPPTMLRRLSLALEW